MSECVVWMEMPKHCEYCPMCRLYRENGRVWCNAANRILKQEWKNPDWTELDIPKPDWCPIICSLPEGHGRLIDADKLKAKKYHSDITNENAVAVAEIDWAETIVPAERSET